VSSTIVSLAVSSSDSQSITVIDGTAGEIGIDPPRNNAVDLDVIFSPAYREGLCQAKDGVL
jgi:hypothetical protein